MSHPLVQTQNEARFTLTRVCETCELLNGLAFKPEEWSATGVPIIRIQNLNGGQEFNCFQGFVPDDYVIQSGTLLFAWSGNRGTSFGPFVWEGPTGLLNQHIFKVIPKTGVDAKWLRHSLEIARERAEREAHGGSGLVHVRREDLLSFRIPTPDEREQSRIAGVLDAMDEAIAKAEAVIAKLRQMRAGLLHDLLARGLDQNGQLRPSPSEAPQLYQNSPLGPIPHEWEVKALALACSLIKDGAHIPPKRVESGPLLLGVRNMIDDRLQLTGADTRVPWQFFDEMHWNWKIQPGDALLAIVGATIGKVARVPDDFEPFTLQRSVAILRGTKDLLENHYLEIFFRGSYFQSLVKNASNATAQAGLYLGQIAGLNIPLPRPDEQLLISTQIREHEQEIRLETTYLIKLIALKSGLMTDLLNGRVRVPETQ